jgi:flagellar motor switch protein FliN/FliY
LVISAKEETSFLSDVPLDIEVELDRQTMTLAEVAGLRPGGVLGLTRSAGENVDIFIGGTLIGYGEIVVIENTMAVRITDFKVEE